MANKTSQEKIRVIELFAGVGGFRLGLERASDRYETIWSNHWEPSTKTQHASNIYVKNFGVEGHQNKDISQIPTSEIPEHDLLVGGFPCQDYSVARTLNHAKGLKGKKGVLWWEIHRILEAKRPAYIFLENVDRLLKSPASQRGRDFAVRLEPNDLPEQSISFPAFKYEELIKETWEESEFKAYLESKFFFVFFQYDRPKKIKGKKVKGRKLVLKKVQFWNMPVADIDAAKQVWAQTISLVKDGNIVIGFKSNCDRITNFPGMADNRVSHVRPHGSDKKDTYPLPVPDQRTQKSEYTKHSFWINNSYVRDSIYHS